MWKKNSIHHLPKKKEAFSEIKVDKFIILLFLFIITLSLLQAASKKQIIDKHNECVEVFNVCRNLLKKIKEKLQTSVKQLEETENIIKSVRKDLSKEIWFPITPAFAGYISPLDDYGLFLSLQFFSLKPTKIFIIENLGTHINIGPNSTSLSLSYSLRGLKMYGSKIHLLYGFNFDIFNFPIKFIDITGIGFSLNF